jgi:hypothetical protein
MDRITVSSNSILSVGYEAETRILEIEFNSGDVYQYYNAPEGEYLGLMNAESHGKYFSTHIKNAYQYRRIG